MMHQLMVQNKIELVTMHDKELLEGLLLSVFGSMAIPFLGKQVRDLWPIHVLFYCALIQHVLLLFTLFTIKKMPAFTESSDQNFDGEAEGSRKQGRGSSENQQKVASTAKVWILSFYFHPVYTLHLSTCSNPSMFFY